MASARVALSLKPNVLDSPSSMLSSSLPTNARPCRGVGTSSQLQGQRSYPTITHVTASCKSQALTIAGSQVVAACPCNGRVAFLGTAVLARTPLCARGRAARRPKVMRVSASAAATAGEGGTVEPTPDTGGSSELVKTLRLGSLFGMWYLFNIYFNIYNKQVLKVFPYAITCTLVQFAVGATFVILMWTTGLYKRPSLTASQLKGIIPLAIVHTLGNMFTNLSLGKVAVSFTHTIKAMEPAFSVLLSALFLGDRPQPIVILSLLPIMGGVALASATEASFNWGGFLTAMSSNVTFQSRNVLSKKLMLKKEGAMDNIQLFSVITVLSFFILLIPTIAIEGVKFTPAFMESAGLNVKEVMTRTLVAGLCFHAYQQVSYMILQVVSPVTHSVGNCVKRVVVIVSSVLVFRTPVSLLNGIGTSLALAGVFAYSRIKASSGKKKSE